MSRVPLRLITVSAALLLGGCAHNPPTSPAAPAERDISATRPITETHRRTIGFLERGVWVSNELEGGRFTDVWMEGDSVLGHGCALQARRRVAQLVILLAELRKGEPAGGR